jgi:hypothetical protein
MSVHCAQYRVWSTGFWWPFLLSLLAKPPLSRAKPEFGVFGACMMRWFHLASEMVVCLPLLYLLLLGLYFVLYEPFVGFFL